MTRPHRFEGHAIVSADDMIADAAGAKPAPLNHPADWARFQAALDAAALILIGRRSHEADPVRKHRPRLVASSQSPGLQRHPDGWWWNPAVVTLAEALETAAPEGGVVAVPGGRLIFDMILQHGFDAFHLSRRPDLTLPGGIPVFSAVAEGRSAAAVLAEAGLRPAETEVLDSAAGVTVTVWRRPDP